MDPPAPGAPDIPSLSLPDEAPYSQPLCTPVDRPILPPRSGGMSPPKKPRRALQPVSAPSQACLPDMSQDTLAMFPPLVAAVSRPPRLPARGGGGGGGGGDRGLAKASMIAALHEHAPMRNPWVEKAAGRGGGAACSESFDIESMGLGQANVATSGVQGDARGLKSCLVASNLGMSSSLHFSPESSGQESNFSVVTKATSRIDGVSYALKKNRVPFETFDQRMTALQEVFGLAGMQSVEGVLRYFMAWWEGGGKYLVVQTEWVDGGGVKGRLEADEVVRFGSAVTGVLERMHKRGAAHLDIKPENVFRRKTEDGESQYLLGDFGLVRKVLPDGAVDQLSSVEAGWVDGRSFDGDGRYLEAFDTCDDDGMAVDDEALDNNPSGTSDDDRFGSSRKRPKGGVRATARPAKRSRSRFFTAPRGDSVDTTPSPEIESFSSRRLSNMTYEADSEDCCTPRGQSLFGDVGDEADKDEDLEDDMLDEEDISESPVVPEEPSETKPLKSSRFRHDASPMRQMPPPPSPHIRPERKNGAPSKNLMAADIFSFGVSLYEVATGKEPATSGPDWHWIRNKPAEVAKCVSKATGMPALAKIVEDCLARDPLSRPSAAAVALRFAAIAPKTSALEQARAEISALKKSNEQMTLALAGLVDSEKKKATEKAGKTKARPKRKSGIQQYLFPKDAPATCRQVTPAVVSPLTAVKPVLSSKGEVDLSLMSDSVSGAERPLA